MKNKKVNSAKPKVPVFARTKLATALGISLNALKIHLRDPQHPPMDDVGAWEMLLAEKGRAGSAPPKIRADIARARLAILNETKKRMARDNAVAEKEMISVAEVRAQCNAAGALFMDSLEKLARELPPALAGLPTTAVASRMELEIESIRRNLTAKMQEIGK